MLVKLTYFKPNGKYYTDGEYRTKCEMLQDIWSQVMGWMLAGDPPGLSPGTEPKDYIVLVDVPEHPHNHPHLVVPKHLRAS